MRRTTIAVVALLFAIQAHAGTITQTISFHFAAHGTTFTAYNQLDPSLAPLNGVVSTVTFLQGGVGNTFDVTNPTTNTISFHATLTWSLITDGGNLFSTSIIPVTLGPNQTIALTPLQIPAPGYVISGAKTTGLSVYIGTGQLAPFLAVGSPFGDNVFVDNSSITVRSETGGTFGGLLDGSETVTYFFGSTFVQPEPASLGMLSLGLVGVAALAWRHRKAKLTA
jgi:hypothetical protein